MKIAVLAHSKKTVGGGLPELRAELKRRGQLDVSWYEVAKSRKVPKAARAALADGPDLLLVWVGTALCSARWTSSPARANRRRQSE